MSRGPIGRVNSIYALIVLENFIKTPFYTVLLANGIIALYFSMPVVYFSILLLYPWCSRGLIIWILSSPGTNRPWFIHCI